MDPRRRPRDLSLRGLLDSFSHLFFVASLMFFILYLLVTNLSPGVAPLREPSLYKPPLAATSSDKFTIGIFSDLHFGEDEHSFGPVQDRGSLRLMRSILAKETLDFVVLDGDLITGENTFLENSTDYVDMIVQPMLEKNVPWASTYGNHDSQFNLSREALFEAESEYDLCYTNQIDLSLPGVTNFYVIVNDVRERPIAILWFFDSRGGRPFQTDLEGNGWIPGWVADETSSWFVRTNAKLRKNHGRALPSLAFVHIPPRIYREAQETPLDPSRYPGLNADNPIAVQGDQGGEDAAFIDALLTTEGLHSIHVGHDHGASWCSTWPGRGVGSAAPFLCFARHTGYGGYGPWIRGARMLELSFAGDQMEVETWIRLENGTMITRVSLNETYGNDLYPVDTGE